MNDENTEQPSKSNPNIENIDFKSAQRTMRALDEIEPILNVNAKKKHHVHAKRRHPVSFKRRGKHLRAAFIGNVTIPLMAVILVSAGSGAGWLAAAFYYKNMEIERFNARRYQNNSDSWRRVTKELERFIADADEHEYYLKAWEEFYRRMEEMGRTQRQDQ